MERRTLVFCLVCLLCVAGTVRADDTEEREFSVFVDGKDAGTSKMTIKQKNDGSCYMSASVNVKFKHLLVVDYTIKAESEEWWKDGRLIGLKTKCSENGKNTEVTAALDDNKMLRLRVNGLDRFIKNETWPSSFWKLADAKFHNKQIPVLECDTGKEYNCVLRYIDAKQIKVGNQLQDCYHFQVAAPGPIDLWYDKYHRIVRQEFTESGHKTVIQLVHIKR